MSGTQTLRRAHLEETRPHHAVADHGLLSGDAPRLTMPSRARQNHVTQIETLLQRYESASPSLRRRGREWYPTMYRLLRSMASHYERTTPQAIAILAATSPNTTLLSNLRFTEAILAGKRLYGCYPKHQEPIIRAILSSPRYPGRFVKGPKCSKFYEAIAGNTNALVLDRWAARAAGATLNPGRNDLGAGIRRELDIAYREAARLCGETTRSMQAIAWLCVREATPNRRGVIPQYLDITKGVA